MKMQRKISVELDHDEALVLFELLSSEIEDSDAASICKVFPEDAQLWALNNLLCVLEKTLTTPFASDYDHQVETAKASLVNRFGKWPWVHSDDS